MYTVNIYIVIEGVEVFWKVANGRVYKSISKAEYNLNLIRQRYKKNEKYVIKLALIDFTIIN